jgi:hypothetical protein
MCQASSEEAFELLFLSFANAAFVKLFISVPAFCNLETLYLSL